MATILNRGQLYSDNTQTQEIALAEATFQTFDATLIEMTKTVDKPGEVYFPGDPITFTITINNNSTDLITGLRFTDTLDAAVIPTEGTTFNVTTTSGVVTSNDRNIIVDGIEVPAAGSVVITIVGEIA